MLFINSFGVEKLPNVLNYEDTLKYLQDSKNDLEPKTVHQ